MAHSTREQQVLATSAALDAALDATIDTAIDDIIYTFTLELGQQLVELAREEAENFAQEQAVIAKAEATEQRAARRFKRALNEIPYSPVRKRTKIQHWVMSHAQQEVATTLSKEDEMVLIRNRVMSSSQQEGKATASKEDRYALLKSHLAITPKTIKMLYDSGYTTPASLNDATPNQVAEKFAALPGMDAKQAKVYIRPLRRMVMLGAVELEEAWPTAEALQKWSIVELKRLGVWEEGFDDLTGVEILRKLTDAGVMPVI